MKAKIFDGIDLMIASSIVVLILVIGCADKGEEITDIEESLPSSQLIDSFFYYKSKYLIESDDYFNLVQDKWSTIIINRDSILDYLLNGSFEKDSTTSLYGNYFDEKSLNCSNISLVKDYSTKSTKICIEEKMPNYIHALYLSEAIIRNDYLFNRRHRTVGLFNPKRFLHDDRVNFLYNVDSISDMDFLSEIVPLTRLDVVWKKYKSWYRSYKLNRQMGTSPLRGTEFKWNDYNNTVNGIPLSENIIYKNDSLLIKKYRIDYQIGNGWLPSKKSGTDPQD